MQTEAEKMVSEWKKRDQEYERRQYSASFVGRSQKGSDGSPMQSVPSTQTTADSFEDAVMNMVKGHKYEKIVAITLAQGYGSEYRFYDEKAIAEIMKKKG